MKAPKYTPTPEQLAAVQDFAKRFGKNWKDALTRKWMNGADAMEVNGHLLRQVRNQGGPSWLATYQPQAVDLVAAVKAHALANYNKSGWDIIVECWSDADIAEAITGAKTEKGAIAKVAKTVKLLGDYRSDIQNA